MDQKTGPQNLPPNPRENANIFSYLCFCWVLPIFWKGRKKTLETDDLYQALKVHKSESLGERLNNAWIKHLAKQEKLGKEPSLFCTTLSVFGLQIALLGLILASIEFFIRCPQPIFLGSLIRYYSSETSDVNQAYLYAGLFLLSSTLNVFLMHPFVLAQLHCGMKLRVAMCSMIYRKALKLSKNALGDTTAGQVVNLLSNDVGRLDLSIMFVHYLWVGPLETILVTYLMYREIGVAAFFGSAFLLSFIPLQAYLGKMTSVLRLKTAIRTDERIRLMNEIIQGIQVIKMYAWEIPFGKLVARTRMREIKVIRYVSYIRGILLSFIMFTTRSSIFVSLIAFALLGNIVTAEKAFVITAYYNILRQTMTVFFPQGIGQFAETLVSIKRIQKYMMYNEKTNNKPIMEYMNEFNKEQEAIKSIQNGSSGGGGGGGGGGGVYVVNNESEPLKHLSEAGVNVCNINAKWNDEHTEPTLNNVNLRIQPGTLVAIIGPVGSGKSSLLQAILGELPIQSGRIQLNGVISYASQDLWIFAGTVRMNILFGQPMDRDRYRQVVKKCALERDFALFPHGDKTIVGERGQSLSGGQKARISLARACYRKASIYLLDDPLSAVDTHVGRHLFNQCIKDFLQNTIVILVTHQLQYLQDADQIVIFNHGAIEAVGTYDSLRQTGLDFAKLLAKNNEEEDANNKSDNPLHRSTSRIQRQNSSASDISDEFGDKDKDNQLPIDEKRSETSIGLSLYKAYFAAGGGLCFFYIMVLFCLFSQLLASGGDYFLTYWVNKEEAENRLRNDGINITENMMNLTGNDSVFKQQIPSDDISYADRLTDIYIFTGIILATIFFTLMRSFLFFNLAMKASVHLHNVMYEGVTRATMYFFNTNPSGRILNRFSKDMGQIDEILPAVMIDVIQIFLSLGGIIVVVAIVNYWFLIPTLVMAVIFYYLRDFYLQSSRNLKRMEATTRSPIYSHLGTSLMGLSTIRAFGAEDMLIEEFDTIQDLNSSAFYLFISASRAFGFWLDIFCLIYIAIVTLSFFVMGADGGSVGLAITQAMGMTGMVQWGMRQSAELENTMTAVERVVEYKTVDPEIDIEKKMLNLILPNEWPSIGGIRFENLSLRYDPQPTDVSTADNDDNLEKYVLKNLTFEIESCEKVGIVGRTGAGKSSLINALFRLSYNTGAIIVDEMNTQAISLAQLRKKISIIPQEPILFSGTMRYNLDPFDEYQDDNIWEALNEVKLKDVMSELPHGLQSKISEGGSNFSVGQRQLVCLARAILRNNKILVMDEATANVDPQTDALIQETIRNKFANCTILTIAHRLNTVIDSDKILVMDAGRVVEFGAPFELMCKKDEPKVFYRMVKEMGQATFDSLMSVAQKASEERKNQ